MKLWSNDFQVLNNKNFPPYWSDMISKFSNYSKRYSSLNSNWVRAQLKFDIKQDDIYSEEVVSDGEDEHPVNIDGFSDGWLKNTNHDEIHAGVSQHVYSDGLFKKDKKMKVSVSKNQGDFFSFINRVISNNGNYTFTASNTHHLNDIDMTCSAGENIFNKQLNGNKISPHVYAVNIFTLPLSYRCNPTSNTISICYPGGFVMSPQKRVFYATPTRSKIHFLPTCDDRAAADLAKWDRFYNENEWLDIDSRVCVKKRSILEDYESLRGSIASNGTVPDTLMPQVVDFNSLYAYSMVWRNICFSTCCYNPAFKILIDGAYRNPYDEKYIDQGICPIKIDSTFTNFVVFIIKPTVKTSVLAKDFITLNNRRKEIKKEYERALARGDNAEATILNFAQANIKLVVNSIYGILNAGKLSTFRPWLASLVTYFGRLNLLRFNLFFVKFCMKNGLDIAERRIVYGDTDSAFVMCTSREIGTIVSQFNNLANNRDVIKIVHERQSNAMLILTKKKYIMYGLETPLYNKNVFTSDKSKPCCTFLKDFLYIIFKYLFSKDLIDYQHNLEGVFTKFCSYDDKEYFFSTKLSKDLQDYHESNRYTLRQMKLVSAKFPSVVFKRGMVLEYTHYDYIFGDSPLAGKIDKNNVAQLNHIEHAKTKTSTILISDAKLIYDPVICGYSLCKYRIFDHNIRSFVNNIFGVDNMYVFKDAYEIFKNVYKKTFDIAFDVKQRVEDARTSAPQLNMLKRKHDALSGKVLKSHAQMVATRVIKTVNDLKFSAPKRTKK